MRSSDYPARKRPFFSVVTVQYSVGYPITHKIRRELCKSLSKRIGLKSASARIRGLDVKIPLLFGLGADHLARTSVPWTAYFMASVLERKRGTVIDIGANVGLYLLWLRSIDDERHYVGFEPNPACYYYLHELIRSNAFRNARVFPIALSNERHPRPFFAKRLGDKMGSLHDFNRLGQDQPRSFELLTDRGDDVLAHLSSDPPSFIKIDVEGAELEVLQGLASTLTQYKPVLLCEIVMVKPDHPSYKERMALFEETLRFLSQRDYLMLTLGPDKRLYRLELPSDLMLGQQTDRILVHKDQYDATIRFWQLAWSLKTVERNAAPHVSIPSSS